MIVRGARLDEGFYVLPRSIREDDRLSWEARGLLIYLLGKPDNWRVMSTDLIAQTAKSSAPASRDKVRKILQELIEAGYVTRSITRATRGKIGGTSYVVHERITRQNQPETEYPAPVPPSPVKRPRVSIETTTSIETTEKLPAAQPKETWLTPYLEAYASVGHISPQRMASLVAPFKDDPAALRSWRRWCQHPELRKYARATPAGWAVAYRDVLNEPLPGEPEVSDASIAAALAQTALYVEHLKATGQA